MRNLLALAALLFLIVPLQAQKIQFEHGCNYDHDDVGGLLTLNRPSDEARRIVDEILAAAAEVTAPRKYDMNFRLMIADVANARAVEKDGIRYILYNEDFLQQFERNSLTRWAAYSLMAHEIGHHLEKHDFIAKDPALRHRQELEADEFSAQVLARMNATREQAMAGIRSFDTDQATATHPPASEREAAIRKAYNEELRRMDAIEAPPETYIELNQRAFTKNRWNLLKGAQVQAVLNEETITIRYRIPQALPGQTVVVCLGSTDDKIYPTARADRTVSGVGEFVLYEPEGSIVWNYNLDRFTKLEVGKGGMLKAMVYDAYDQPRPPSFWKKMSGPTLTGLGAIATGIGIWQYVEGQNIYQVYDDVRNPNDPVYAEESRADRYARANDHNLLGQYLTLGGSLSLIGGVILIIETSNHQKSYLDALCWQNEQFLLEPLLSAPVAGATVVGFRITF